MRENFCGYKLPWMSFDELYRFIQKVRSEFAVEAEDVFYEILSTQMIRLADYITAFGFDWTRETTEAVNNTELLFKNLKGSTSTNLLETYMEEARKILIPEYSARFLKNATLEDIALYNQ